MRGGTLRFPPLKLPSLKSLPVTVAGHWVLPSEVCAVYSVGRPPDRLCRSSNGCALRLAWAVFPRRNRLLLVLRSSSQLLLRRLCSHVNARKVHSHADCALAPSRCSHPCVEHPMEGINIYWEQSQNYFSDLGRKKQNKVPSPGALFNWIHPRWWVIVP